MMVDRNFGTPWADRSDWNGSHGWKKHFWNKGSQENTPDSTVEPGYVKKIRLRTYQVTKWTSAHRFEHLLSEKLSQESREVG